MKLNEIANNPGAHKRKAKVGRGSSSGLGKTSGRGVKGAKARTGNSVYGFEGGQMPLHMRMPKRGFRNIFAQDFAEVTLTRLQRAIDAKSIDVKAKITNESLLESGVARRSRHGVRLIGNAPLSVKLDLEVSGASSGARAAVEKAGGTLRATFEKKVYKNKKGEPGKRQQRRAQAAERREARRNNAG